MAKESNEQNEEAHRQKMERLRNRAEERQAARKEQQDLASGKRVVCPYCKSTNTEKISMLNRAVSISIVGAASSKLSQNNGIVKLQTVTLTMKKKTYGVV